MKMQGKADSNVRAPKVEPRPYAINQNFPSQLGSAIDPHAAEKFHDGAGYSAAHNGPTDGMGQGPGANRKVRGNGSQGRH
jgi:hypothetical protein